MARCLTTFSSRVFVERSVIPILGLLMVTRQVAWRLEHTLRAALSLFAWGSLSRPCARGTWRRTPAWIPRFFCAALASRVQAEAIERPARELRARCRRRPRAHCSTARGERAYCRSWLQESRRRRAPRLTHWGRR